MISLVVVSHSRALAQAAVGLAAEMVPEPNRPQIAVAAGLEQDTFGTDAAAISEAITLVDSPDGVLVLMDLGSALLSAEMALEFLDPEVADRVRLCSAPLVEGLVSAVVTASTGADLDAVAQEAHASLQAKVDQVGDGPPASSAEVATTPDSPAADALQASFTIANPHGLHARPVAALVGALRGLDAQVLATNLTTGKGPVSARSVTKVTGLGITSGQHLGISASGPDAQTAIAALTQLAAEGFGEDLTGRTPGVAETTAAAPPAASTASGRQIVLGPVLVTGAPVDTAGYLPGDNELARLSNAVDQVRADLARRAAGPHGDIFAAQSALLEDDELLADLHDQATTSGSAVQAVGQVLEATAAAYDQLPDPYLAERGQDIRSLQRQLLLVLVGGHEDRSEQPHVLVVPELDALTAAELDTGLTLGVITVLGGATGHGVIVASGRGIAVLTGVAEAAELSTGQLVAFDPTTRQLWIDPDADTLARVQALALDRESEDQQARALADQPALTASGQRILVEANISSVADAVRAATLGAEGSGLVRTELLFGDLAIAPTAAQQAAAFIEIGRALRGQTITIRTWDVGGDKPLPYLPQQPELNPFLGERGLRTMTRAEDFFAEQLRGIVLASREVSVRVMFPMVTLPSEVVWARGVLDRVLTEEHADPISVGMMVEVPAAAVRAADFAGLVDFVSIGTNDLTQYTMAVDRGNATVAHLAQGNPAAVMDLIRATCAGLPGVTAAVCGDLASDPEATSDLVSAGITELSVRPGSVPAVKQAVRAV